jgi:hypothetical protein
MRRCKASSEDTIGDARLSDWFALAAEPDMLIDFNDAADIFSTQQTNKRKKS